MLVNQMKDIRYFHHKFEQAYEGPPRLLDGDLAEFRIKFLLEEVKELGELFGLEVTTSIKPMVDKPEPTPENMALALDALVDLDYVLKGTVHLLGYDRLYTPAWVRVHTANMKKVLTSSTAMSLAATGRGYAGDVIKPPGWVAPDHTPAVAADLEWHRATYA